MRQIIKNFWMDESGFVVASELILIATIGVLSLVVGLSEVAYAINQELADVGSAISSLNPSTQINGSGVSKASSSQSNSNGGDLVCSVAPTGEN